jgi:RNA polymerase sigma-70 factor, ECF subfamily
MDDLNLQEENQLIGQFNVGDPLTFEPIVRTYQDRIYNLCRYLLGTPQDAEDAAQEVFIKAFRKLKDFKPESSLYTWLYRIGVNTCLDHKKKSRPETFKDESLGEALPSTEPSPEQHYQSKQTGWAIQSAFNQLSKNSRAIIVLKEIEGLSYEEIAEIMDTSVGTVKSRLSRTREDLRHLLQKECKPMKNIGTK